jgi:hypothetical protein
VTHSEKVAIQNEWLATAELEEAKAENARLREALGRIAGIASDQDQLANTVARMERVARAALKRGE